MRAHICKTNNTFLSLDLSEALEKMKGVYEQNPQMGDPSSLEPQITETAHNIGRLRGELAKYEVITHSTCTYTVYANNVCMTDQSTVFESTSSSCWLQTWLSEAVGGEESSNAINNNTQHG